MLDRFAKYISNQISRKLDSLLKIETSFPNKIDYFIKLLQQQKNIIKQNIYTNCSKRIIKSDLVNILCK